MTPDHVRITDGGIVRMYGVYDPGPLRVVTSCARCEAELMRHEYVDPFGQQTVAGDAQRAAELTLTHRCEDRK